MPSILVPLVFLSHLYATWALAGWRDGMIWPPTCDTLRATTATIRRKQAEDPAGLAREDQAGLGEHQAVSVRFQERHADLLMQCGQGCGYCRLAHMQLMRRRPGGPAVDDGEERLKSSWSHVLCPFRWRDRDGAA